MRKNTVITTDEILITLCSSVTQVLGAAGNAQVAYSPMVQKIQKTCLRPDLGCFVLFDGGFSGLVIINFTAEAALEIYRKYMMSMGMPESELAQFHTSDEVGNVMGELMNQIVGDFTNRVRLDLHTSINQSQPKMMAINKQVQILINTQLDQPQARRVTFSTPLHNIFYMAAGRWIKLSLSSCMILKKRRMRMWMIFWPMLIKPKQRVIKLLPPLIWWMTTSCLTLVCKGIHWRNCGCAGIQVQRKTGATQG